MDKEVMTVTMETIKQQLLQEALSIIKNTKEGVLKALDYLQAEIPDIIKQFLSWEFSVGVMLLVLGLIFFIFGLCMVRWAKRHQKVSEGFSWVVPIISWVIGTPFIIANTFKVVHISVAPKIFLIKWIMNNIHLVR